MSYAWGFDQLGKSKPDRWFGTDERCALMSSDEKYRYALFQKIRDGNRFVSWVMINPSKADHNTSDPTFAKCVRYAKSWGYDGMIITNLYAYRATNPKDLVVNPNINAWFNDRFISLASEHSELTVCGWGSKSKFPKGRDSEVVRLLKNPHCLGLNKDGSPMHPLFLKGNLKPITYGNDQCPS